MPQSLGPAKCMIQLCTSQNKYSKKWVAALKRELSFIPDIDSICSLLTNKKASEVKPLISVLCDILLITFSRQQHRANITPNVLAHVLFRKLFDEVEFTYKDDGEDVELIHGFNFSGRGWYSTYEKISKMNFEINGRSSQTNKHKDEQVTINK